MCFERCLIGYFLVYAYFTKTMSILWVTYLWCTSFVITRTRVTLREGVKSCITGITPTTSYIIKTTEKNKIYSSPKIKYFGRDYYIRLYYNYEISISELQE